MRSLVSATKQQTTGRHARKPLAPSTRSAVGLQRTLGNEAVQRLMESEMRAPGEPLAPSVRADMEARFGADFGAVRIHTGAQAARSSAAVNANAYTVGRDITFASGQYAPHTATGRHLLAHELAHVVQQSRGGRAPALHSAGHLEADAARAAAAVAHGSGAVDVGAASGVGMARQEKDKDDPEARKKPKLPIGQSDVPGPAPWWTPLDFSQPLKLGSDVQMQNLGWTQYAWVARAIQPFATLEATNFWLLQSATDPRQGWTGQGGGQLHARFTFNPNLELGIGGSYGRIATLGGEPLLGPNKFGSTFLSLHVSEAQPHIPEENELSDDEPGGTFRGAGFFAQGGAAFGAGPSGETGWFFSGIGAYSWVWPKGYSPEYLPEFLKGVLQGLDVNAGTAVSRYGQVSGVNIGEVLMPFASVNLSLPAKFNLEAYGSLPVGLGGNLSDPTASGTPLSLRLGAGLGWQIPFGDDYAFGAEFGLVREFANVTVPGVAGAQSANWMPWLNIGFGAINRKVDFGNPCAFPSRF
jgi:hypothetical protein